MSLDRTEARMMVGRVCDINFINEEDYKDVFVDEYNEEFDTIYFRNKSGESWGGRRENINRIEIKLKRKADWKREQRVESVGLKIERKGIDYAVEKKPEPERDCGNCAFYPSSMKNGGCVHNCNGGPDKHKFLYEMKKEDFEELIGCIVEITRIDEHGVVGELRLVTEDMWLSVGVDGSKYGIDVKKIESFKILSLPEKKKSIPIRRGYGNTGRSMQEAMEKAHELEKQESERTYKTPYFSMSEAEFYPKLLKKEDVKFCPIGSKGDKIIITETPLDGNPSLLERLNLSRRGKSKFPLLLKEIGRYGSVVVGYSRSKYNECLERGMPSASARDPKHFKSKDFPQYRNKDWKKLLEWLMESRAQGLPDPKEEEISGVDVVWIDDVELSKEANEKVNDRLNWLNKKKGDKTMSNEMNKDVEEMYPKDTPGANAVDKYYGGEMGNSRLLTLLAKQFPEKVLEGANVLKKKEEDRRKDPCGSAQC